MRFGLSDLEAIVAVAEVASFRRAAEAEPRITRTLGLIRRRGRALSAPAQELYAMLLPVKRRRPP